MRHLVLEDEEVTQEASPSFSLSTLSSPKTIDTFNSVEITVETTSSKQKIVNIASLIDYKLKNDEKFFSFELYSSEKCNKDIYERFFSEINQNSLHPLFYAKTRHEDLNSKDPSNHFFMEITEIFPNNTLLHVTVNDSKKCEITQLLNDALAQGKTNIFALRGDRCTGSGDFGHAVDLVRFIRKNYGNKFVICVAGYPEMHPKSLSKEMDLFHLKEKVDAGANFIITQIFFETKVFVEFVEECRKYGINIPIIPGIFPIQSFTSLSRMAKFCNVEIPRDLLQEISCIDNDDDVYTYGILMARKLITEILASRSSGGFHLFTLNRASVAIDVCRNIFD